MKLIGCVLKFFLALILFMLIGAFTTIITPYFSAENYSPGDKPNRLFRVIVEIVDEETGEKGLGSFQIKELTGLQQGADYKLYRSKSGGQCSGISFWCRATAAGFKKQLIELKYSQENYSLYNKYYVDADMFEPVYFRIMDRGSAMGGFLASIVLTPIALLLLRFTVKKFRSRVT